MSYLQAWSMEFLPWPLLTRDNYRSMQVPSVCDCAFPFGIQPVALEAAAPAWLAPAVRATERGSARALPAAALAGAPLSGRKSRE